MTNPMHAEARPVAVGQSSATPIGAIAIDVGGTTLKGAVFQQHGRLVAQRQLPSFAVKHDVLESINTLIAELLADAAARDCKVEFIGLCSPGLVDSDSGTVRVAANLGWKSVGLREVLQARYGLPVVVEHDARAAALAEKATHPRNHAGFSNFILIPIGTGVSAAIVASDVLLIGATHAAGEFGHMPVVPNGDLCGCGGRGCVEAYASSSSIAKRYRLTSATTKTTPEIANSTGVDPAAKKVWGEAVEALGAGIIALTALLDPAIVVIGGGLSNAGDTLLAPLRRQVEQGISWRTAPEVVLSALGSYGGLIGAGMLAWHPGIVPATLH